MTQPSKPNGKQFSLRTLLVLPPFVGCYMLAVRYLNELGESIGWRLAKPLLILLVIGWLVGQTVAIVVGAVQLLRSLHNLLGATDSSSSSRIEQDLAHAIGDDQFLTHPEEEPKNAPVHQRQDP